jgi:hypothetical protein
VREEEGARLRHCWQRKRARAGLKKGHFGWAKSARESRAVQQASSARKEGVQQQGRGPNLARLHQQKKAENKRPYRPNFLSKEG